MANNLERAKEIIDKRREAAECEAEERRFQLETVSPELKEVNAAIARAGLAALQAISIGKDTDEAIRRLQADNLANQKKRKDILASLGLPEDYLDVHYTCPECEDTGTVRGRYCKCFKDVLLKLQYEELNAVSPAKLSTFESFSLDYYKGIVDERTGMSAYENMAQILQYCKDYAEDFTRESPSIIMCGQTGLGKTHLSLAIANRVISKGYNVIYGTAHSLMSRLEKDHFGKVKEDPSPEDLILGCDLLIIDDLGAEFSTQFTNAEIYNIINSRILTGLPTVISTNLMYEEIASRYSDRVYSRIIGSYTPLEFFGRDVRQLKS